MNVIQYYRGRQRLPNDFGCTEHIIKTMYKHLRDEVKQRRVLKAFHRSRRNQPNTPVFSDWVCDECGKAGRRVEGPSGCFRQLYCAGCGKETEHSGVIG